MTPSLSNGLSSPGSHLDSAADGVSVAEWALERTQWQNPRLRSLLGCIKLLEEVFESNYAILHCSSERVLGILEQAKKVAKLVRTDFAFYLSHPSSVPRLERARQEAVHSTKVLYRTVLADLEGLDEEISEDQLPEVRKILCDSIVNIHNFLLGSLGRFLAADPRSQHDADYFLSKSFPRDIEESEWLHSSVEGLNDYLQTLEPLHFSSLAELILEQKLLPDGPLWTEVTELLSELTKILTPKLKEMLMLRRIRLDELELLALYASQIPRVSALVVEIHGAGQELIHRVLAETPERGPEREQTARILRACHEVYSHQIAHLTSDLGKALQDLRVFVVFWLENVKKRRALVLK